jgi:hypothetical protein
MAVNVKLSDRRALAFETLDDILRDAEQITSGAHRTTGNWTAAQNIHHLAFAIGMANRGIDLKIPLAMKLVGRGLRLLGQHVKPIKPGIKPPARIAAAFEPPKDVELHEALQLLRDEIDYAKQRGMTHPSPLFGKLSDAEWIEVHCRHAELHLSFIRPADTQ